MPYRTTGGMAAKTFTVYRTRHGPVIRGGRQQVDQRRPDEQASRGAGASSRTKAVDYASYMKVAELRANSSNNTIFADSKARLPICTRSSFPSATTASISSSRWTAPIQPPTGKGSLRSAICRIS